MLGLFFITLQNLIGVFTRMAIYLNFITNKVTNLIFQLVDFNGEMVIFTDKCGFILM